MKIVSAGTRTPNPNDLSITDTFDLLITGHYILFASAQMS